MDTNKFDDIEGDPLADGLLDDEIDYDFLKSEIAEKGPVFQTHLDSGLVMILNITPCLCGFKNCTDDVISVVVQHGVVSFRSTVEKDELVSRKNLNAFFHDFFHYPEAFYSSCADEQGIEFEIRRSLGIEPFEVYTAEDSLEVISKHFSGLDNFKADFWQAHNLLPLLRILNNKRQLRKWARNEAENVPGEECDQLISEVFDVGFLAGRLWSEYRTKANLEEVVEKGEASIKAQLNRTEASGRLSADRRVRNLKHFMKEIEKLAEHYPAFSETAILERAYENAKANDTKMPKSKKTLDDYCTALRSEEPFKFRYEAIFRKNA